MIDYSKPWGWEDPDKKKMSNVIAPLGAGNQEQAPAPQQLPHKPTMAEAAVQGVGKEAINTGLDKAYDAYKAAPQYVAKAPLSSDVLTKMTAQSADAAMAADAMGGASDLVSGAADAAMAADAISGATDAVGGATDLLAGGAEAAGSGASALGPLGAAAGGLMEGKYDKAAGAAAGAVAGQMLIPIPVLGGMIGAKLGGLAGDQLGNIFGFAEGTPSVPSAGGKGGGVAPIMQPAAMATNQMNQRTPATSGGKGGQTNSRGLPAYATNYYGSGGSGWTPSVRTNAPGVTPTVTGPGAPGSAPTVNPGMTAPPLDPFAGFGAKYGANDGGGN